MNKNTAIVSIVLALIVGTVIGACVIGYGGRNKYSGMHQMPDMNMSEMMASMNDELKGKTGSDFDKAFLTEMIVHHKGAVEMAKLALTNAEHQEVKNLADGIIAAQNKEINNMQAWFVKWFLDPNKLQ
jgi:uncharacterized protein (DUF305 family)